MPANGALTNVSHKLHGGIKNEQEYQQAKAHRDGPSTSVDTRDSKTQEVDALVKHEI